MLPRRRRRPARARGRGLGPLARRRPVDPGRRPSWSAPTTRAGRRCSGSTSATTGGRGAGRLTPDDGAYADIEVSPDGRWVYALRSAVDAPPAPVRVPLDPAAGAVQPLPGPAAALGRPPRCRAGSPRSTRPPRTARRCVRGWRCRPPPRPRDPAPLLVWIHGGPLGSWNAWSWRWNPWVAVRPRATPSCCPTRRCPPGTAWTSSGAAGARGARRPTPTCSPLTDAAEARDDVDATRTAAMGGSFGGYMANWVAGHTDRFGAVVTHASPVGARPVRRRPPTRPTTGAGR